MFDWLGESPAAGVQWVDIILSFVAFGIAIMALPTILQMFFGRAHTNARFERAVEGEDRSLVVFLDNPPIRSRLLRKLGVRRDTAQSLTASFRICEAGTGKIVDAIRHAMIFTDEDATHETPKHRISLPATYSVAASFVVAMWNKEKRQVMVPPDRLRTVLVLSPGYYRAIISLIIDGEPEMIASHFRVGQKADDLIWAN